MILNFEVLSDAGLTAGDLAKIVEVPLVNGEIKTISRTTAFNWTRGISKPVDYIYPQVSKVLTAVESALQNNELPLKLATKRIDRVTTLKTVLAKYM